MLWLENGEVECWLTGRETLLTYPLIFWVCAPFQNQTSAFHPIFSTTLLAKATKEPQCRCLAPKLVSK
jgi:hypothetical protein